ncbi:MAG: DJ-1 family glyoxalase III [Cellulosilyticaceae bacterium]
MIKGYKTDEEVYMMKVVVFFGTGYEEVEALAVVDVLRRGGVETVMAGVTDQEVCSARNICIKMDTCAEQINYDEVDMLVIPGGLPGVHNVFASDFIKEKVQAFKKAGKWVAAICAGPGVLGKWGVLENEKATCYPGFEKELLGATHTGERVVVSNNVVTGIGAGASFEFALKLLEIAEDKEKSEQIKKAMLIN